MNFLINLFSCGSSQHSKPKKYVPSLCTDRSQKHLEQNNIGKDKSGSQMIRSSSNSTKPLSSMSQIVPKKLPQTKYTVLRGCFSDKQKKIDWGDLVGVVNYNPKISQLTPSTTFKIRIGRNQQINCFATMRAFALDWLIVYWGELEGDYGVKHFIRCRQPIIFILQDWQALLKLIQIYEEELLNQLGDYCLLASKNKIFFNIITYQNTYVVQFQTSDLIHQNVKELLDKAVGVSNLNQQDFSLLLQKMTLYDYINLIRDKVMMGRKIRQYLKQIQSQKRQKERFLQEPQAHIQAFYMDNLSQKQEQQKPRKQSKQSDVELQAEYFASIRRNKEERNQQDICIENQQDQMLKIFEFNNGSDLEQSDEVETQQVVIKPFNAFRKIRSKSEDAIYLPDNNMDLDEEFYQKYS